MTTKILLCGYSLHTKRFYTGYKSGIPMYLLRLQTEGHAKTAVNGKQYILERGDLLLLKPGDIYELFVDNTKNLSGDYHIICENAWLNEWWNRSPKPTVSRIHIEDRLIILWRQLIAEKHRPSSEEGEEIIDYLIRSLCLSLQRAITESKGSMRRYPHVVIRMMRYIEENATNPLKVKDVADHVGLSASRAAHLFKSSFGKSIIEYAIEIRLSIAMEYLKNTNLTLSMIAELCGFGNYSYFHRVFKKKFGMPPGALVRKNK